LSDDEQNVDEQLDEGSNGHTNNARTGAIAGTTVTESAKGTEGTTVTGDRPER
jgi:hypothetical protein